MFCVSVESILDASRTTKRVRTSTSRRTTDVEEIGRIDIAAKNSISKQMRSTRRGHVQFTRSIDHGFTQFRIDEQRRQFQRHVVRIAKTNVSITRSKTFQWHHALRHQMITSRIVNVKTNERQFNEEQLQNKLNIVSLSLSLSYLKDKGLLPNRIERILRRRFRFLRLTIDGNSKKFDFDVNTARGTDILR
jgi:hypothetical protein